MAPITPNGICALPSFVSIAGMIVCIGRLRGPDRVRMARLDAEGDAAIVQQHPLFGPQMPEPNDWNSELMKRHALRSRSTTVR